MRHFLSPIKPVIYGSILTGILLTGCDIFGLNKGDACSGTLDSVMTTSTLGGLEDDFYLATPTDHVSKDSALLNSACPATFTMSYGYRNRSLQAAVMQRGGYAQPKDFYQDIKLSSYEKSFHVNRDDITFDAPFDVNTYSPDSIPDFQITLKDHGDYPGSGSRGVFYIKSGLKSVTFDLDSVVIMRGKILYYH